MEAVWVFAPVLGALLAHAPVLRFDLFPSLKRPIDCGATLRGRRLLGDNKTWRGAIAMWSGVVAAVLVLFHWPPFWSRLPEEIRTAGPGLYGVLLGLGTVLGELPNSFLKRQLDIAPGMQKRSAAGVLISVYDQGDFVLGTWVTLAPIWVMSGSQALTAFAVVTVVHLASNVVGYLIGARKTAI